MKHSVHYAPFNAIATIRTFMLFFFRAKLKTTEQKHVIVVPLESKGRRARMLADVLLCMLLHCLYNISLISTKRKGALWTLRIQSSTAFLLFMSCYTTLREHVLEWRHVCCWNTYPRERDTLLWVPPIRDLRLTKNSMIFTSLAHNTALCFYQTTRRHIPEDNILHVDCYESLKLDGAASHMQHSGQYTRLGVPDPHPSLSSEIQNNVSHFVCWVVLWYLWRINGKVKRT
jgi:hypothetical protein